MFHGVVDDHARRGLLHEPGQGHGDLDGEGVGDEGAGLVGLEAIGPVELAEDLGLLQLPGEAAGSVGVVVGEDVADGVAQGGDLVLDPGAAALAFRNRCAKPIRIYLK